jgi:cell division protein FtsL
MKNIKTFNYLNINEKFIVSILLVVFLMCIGFYVFQIISLTENSYYFTNYQKKIKTLNEEIANLEVSYSQSLNLNNIEEKAKELGFQKIERVKFIKAYNTVAKKNK